MLAGWGGSTPPGCSIKPVSSQAPTPLCYLPVNSLAQLAPENTLMSLRKTAECGAAVFETDVMVR